ncbi:MAG: phosphatidate cytidylyltransferase, partial [Alphaproteobacteria bacterium]
MTISGMTIAGHAFTPVGTTLVVLGAVLGVATVLIGAMRAAGKPQAGELMARIGTWWVLFAFVAIALAIGRTGGIVLLALVSFLALKEYFSLIPTRRADRLVLLVAYLAIPIQYVLIDHGQYGIFIVFIPVYMLMAVPAAMVIRGETDGFLRATATIHWGLMACVFAVGHAAALLTIDDKSVSNGAFDIRYGAALFLVLLILTGLNDVAQYVSGKLFGQTRISPTVSPNKTREGFIGGVIVTAMASAILAP